MNYNYFEHNTERSVCHVVTDIKFSAAKKILKFQLRTIMLRNDCFRFRSEGINYLHLLVIIYKINSVQHLNNITINTIQLQEIQLFRSSLSMTQILIIPMKVVFCLTNSQLLKSY